MKRTWWWDEETPTRRVRLEVVREVREPGGYAEEQRLDAVADWHLRCGAHYLRFTAQDEDNAAISMTLRIRPDEVTLIQDGGRRWQQVFRTGVRTGGRLLAGNLSIPVEVATHRLDVRVTPSGGQVRVTFTQTVAGHPQPVRLWVRFSIPSEGGDQR